MLINDKDGFKDQKEAFTQFFLKYNGTWQNRLIIDEKAAQNFDLKKKRNGASIETIRIQFMQAELYYARQIALPEVGVEGQKKLAQAKCLVVGAGGLGCPALYYLAAAGVGSVGICDGDRVEIHNLHRQILYRVEDVGRKKVHAAAEALHRLNPLIELRVHDEAMNGKNCIEILSQYDLILDCTDHFQSKFLLNDACCKLNKPLIRASIHQFEGQLQCYLPGAPCLRCVWPEIPPDSCVGTCAEMGVLGSVTGFFGNLQAMEALKYFLHLPLLPPNTLFMYNLLSHTQQRVILQKNPKCPVCSAEPQSISNWEVVLNEISLSTFQLVDIREADELASVSLKDHPYRHMPLSMFDPSQLDPQGKYLFFCARGRRSNMLVTRLRHEGWVNTYSLMGGIAALKTIYE